MPRTIDLGRYINPGNAIPQVDIAAGLRWAAEQNLRREQTEQQGRQFATTDSRVKQEHQDEMARQQRVEADTNSRFALTLDQQENMKNQELKAAQSQKRLALTQKAREAVAKGDWNTASALSGTLADLGTKVDITQNPDGTPNYRFENPEEKAQDQQSFQSIMQSINGNRGSVNQSAHQPVSPLFTEKNPFDTLPGQSALSAPDQQLSQELQQSAQPTLDALGESPTEAPAQEQQQPQGQIDPRSLNSQQLGSWNSMRLDPVLQGIEESFPFRFQSNIRPMLQSYKSMQMDPESTLDQLQKPLDTAAGLYRGEMAAEGQMARSSIGQGGQQSSEARMRENEAWRRAQIKAKEIGVNTAIDNQLEFDTIREKINSSDPNSQADAIKQLINLREGNRITDQDFKIAVEGIASNWEQLKFAVEKVYHTGLNDLQKHRFNSMLDVSQREFDKRIRAGAAKLRSFKKAFRFEPERYGVENYIRGTFPEKYWDDEAANFDPMSPQGGMNPRVPSGNSSSRSVTVTAPTTQEAVQGVQDLESEVDQLLSE